MTEVQFDPAEISYREVLDFFWTHHDPAQHRKKQYQSAILYETDDEKKIAHETYAKAKASSASGLEKLRLNVSEAFRRCTAISRPMW